MNNRSSDPQPWKLIKQKSGPSLKVFASRIEYRLNPRNGKELECLILDSKDWVNVVALTPAKETVLVKQFRFGSASVTIEIPGGVIDAGESHAEFISPGAIAAPAQQELTLARAPPQRGAER